MRNLRLLLLVVVASVALGFASCGGGGGGGITCGADSVCQPACAADPDCAGPGQGGQSGGAGSGTAGRGTAGTGTAGGPGSGGTAGSGTAGGPGGGGAAGTVGAAGGPGGSVGAAGTGGATCGPASVSGQVSFTGVSDIAFNVITPTVQHKRDIDQFEDGCFNLLDFSFGYGAGCALRVIARDCLDAQGRMKVQSINFMADSQCPNFPDAVEGTYTGSGDAIAGSWVQMSTPRISERNVATSCVSAQFQVILAGTLTAGTRTLTLGPSSTLAANGPFVSNVRDAVCPGMCAAGGSGGTTGSAGQGGTGSGGRGGTGTAGTGVAGRGGSGAAGTTGTGGTVGGPAACQNPSGAGTLTTRFASAVVNCGSKPYVVAQNDTSGLGQSLSYGPGARFRITSQNGTGSGAQLASWPAVFTGRYGNLGTSTADSGLPRAVSQITTGSLQTSLTWADNGAPGSYDAGYDVWFSTTSAGDPTISEPSGGYMMIWFYDPPSQQPPGVAISGGTVTVTIGGRPFTVWYGTLGTRPCVTYAAQQRIDSWTFSLGDFIRDAATRNCGTATCINPNWYLSVVLGRFEIWSGGTGLEIQDFGITVP